MSEVEETLERIKNHKGVEGYVICNKQGLVLRRFPAMPQDLADQYGQLMRFLAAKARHTVRDLDPQNELNYLRIRAKRHEIMVALDAEFHVIVLQRWSSASAQ